MPKASPQQYSFSAGEVSPLLYGRQDTEKYRAAVSRCRNWIPLVQGPMTRRPGFVFNQLAKFPLRFARLIPFRFSIEQNYILEFGHEYIRFFTQGGFLSGLTRPINDVTLGASTTIISTAHGFSDGDRIYLEGAGLEVHTPVLANREVIVAAATANDFEARDINGGPIDTSMFTDPVGTITGGVSTIFELATDYEEADLSELRFLQSADVLYLLHPQIASRKLLRTGALTWALQEVNFRDGPWGPLNTATTTLGLSGTGETGITISANNAVGINDGLGFLTTDVGRLLRWLDEAGNWTWYRITARSSPLAVTAERFGGQPSGILATKNWRLGLWSDTTGWPSTGSFHEDRLVLGGAPTTPMRVDFSRTSDYENFSPSDPDGTVLDDSAVGVVLSSGQVNAVKWLVTDSKGLQVGTSGGEWVVSPSSFNEALTPSNISARRSSAHGAASLDAVRVGNATLYVQRGGRKLREMAYVFEVDGFRSPDLSVLSEHLTRPSIQRDLVIQRQPAPILWAVRADGALLGITYDREQGVVAWHAHEVGGELESLAVIPDPAGTYDEVYAIIKRGNRRCVEFMAKLWEEGDEQEDAVYVDSAYVAFPSSNRVNGLQHLEGETVNVWADGGVLPPGTVTNGFLELDTEYDLVTVGLPISSVGVSLPLEAGAADGSAQGKTKRLNRVGFWLMDCVDLEYGSDADHLTRLLFADWAGVYGVSPPVFTGVVRRRFEGDYDLLGQVYVKVDSAAPATLLSMAVQVDTQDDS